MKKIVLFAACLVLVFAVPAMAADALSDKPLKIAVVDLQAVFKDSKSGKSIQDQLEKMRKNFQDQFTKQEEKLRGEDQELTKLRPTLSADEFTAKRREFEKHVAGVQRDAQEKRKQLEQAVAKATQQVEQKVFEVVGKIAEDKSVTLVLSRNQVFLAQRNIDITKETIANLDAQLTHVPVVLQPVKSSYYFDKQNRMAKAGEEDAAQQP